MLFTQTDRLMSIHTPLGEDALILNGFSGHEAISQLSKFDLDLLREGEAIPFQDIIGQQVTIKLVMTGDETRYFNGFISRFVQTGSETGIIHYRAEMVPWLWFLTRTADCRIFQNISVPDILEQIFSDLGFTDYDLQLKGTYDPRDYCVQYRETDYNFVARLMEQYGMFYFFKHEEEKHTLILGDSPETHPDHLGPETVSWEPTAHALEEDVITSLACEKDLRPGNFAHTDYNFTTPRNNLMAEEPSVVDIGGNSQYEIYDYPGEYKDRSEGVALARIRMQEIETQHFLVSGRSTCRGFSAGAKFTLSDYFPSEMNQVYLLTSVHHVGSMGTTYSAGSGGEEAYSNSFAGIPHSVPFRPPQKTPKPIVQGPQTAKVVGPSGEEIWCDEYGRIKVQFHWDREGQNDEESSCWVRVSQAWAGKQWGAQFIPRIGHEVIIEFLEGDPDRPIATGCVYNDENMPPYDVPANQTQSGFKTRSSKGGGPSNFNEVRFEDKKGQEQLYIHAEKNLDKIVEANETADIGANRTHAVHANDKLDVDADRTVHVKGAFTETIDGGETRTVTSGVTETISGGETRTVTSGVTETITGGETRTVTGDKKETITGMIEQFVGSENYKNWGLKNTFTVGATNELFVGAKSANTLAVTAETYVGLKSSLCAAVRIEKTAGPHLNEAATNDIKGKAGIELNCAEGGSSISMKPGKIVLKSGGASIEIQSGGDIIVNGTKFDVTASSNFQVHSGGSKLKVDGGAIFGSASSIKWV